MHHKKVLIMSKKLLLFLFFYLFDRDGCNKKTPTKSEGMKHTIFITFQKPFLNKINFLVLNLKILLLILKSMGQNIIKE